MGIAAPGCFARRGRSRHVGAVGHFVLKRGNEIEQEHLAAAAIGVIRIMSASGARHPALSGSGASSMFGCRAVCLHSLDLRGCLPSRLVSNVELWVTVSSVRSWSPGRRSCGRFEGPWHSRAFRFGECSFAGPYNNKMEPTRLIVRAIMSPWRAAHFERWTGGRKRTSDH